MAIHEDGTMDVKVDGKLERRRYSINRGGHDLMGRSIPLFDQYEPETRDGEMVMRTICGDVFIVRTQE